MTPDDLDAVIAIEQTAYSHPWTRGNFRDSLNPLFDAQCLWLHGELLGYFLAMRGFEEMHLLNITVAPAHQGQGWGHMMLDALALMSRQAGAQWLWLEVRQSNQRALQVYARYGFKQVSIRKDYYPAGVTRPDLTSMNASVPCWPKWACACGGRSAQPMPR
jgi:ribosomal-protein-alanine N-acetyltransferase